MILRILLALILIVLFVVANYFRKNKENFSRVLAKEESSQQNLIEILAQFSRACFILFIIGIPCIIIGYKITSLLFIAAVMLISAFYSIKLSKQIS